MPSQLERRRGFLLCAAFLACSLQLPVLAQQSDWVTPGSPEAQVDHPMTQPAAAPMQQQSGVNPGRGWMPKHSLPMQQEAPLMAPVQQQAQMAPMQQPLEQGVGGPQLGEDGSMPWQDIPKRRPAVQQQQAMQPMPQSGSAFQQPQPGAQDAWSLPPAQQQMDMQWAQNLPQVPMSAVTPTATAKAPAKPAGKPAVKATAAKPSAKPGVKTATAAKASPNQSQLAGHVMQSANAKQPTSQFVPNAGFPGGNTQMAGGQPGPYGMPTQGAMQQGMPMQGMQQMGAMQQMPGMPVQGAMQQGMPMQAMQQMGGASPMQGMSQMGAASPMQGMGGMSAMQGMGAMGGGMGMDPMSALMGATGGSGNPLDAIGKAIAGAAAMGLIPSSGNANLNAGYNPNVGPYAQMQAGPNMGGQQMQQMQQVQQVQQTRPRQASAQQKKKKKSNQSNVAANVANRVTQAGSMMMNMGLSRVHW